MLSCLALSVVAAGASAPAALGAPNDPSFSLQWGDSNTGQSIPTQGVEVGEPLGPPADGTPGADDRALAAWEVTTGSRSIVIGELDTGVEYAHPDLSANIWSNPGGIGGCPAQTHGYDVLSGTCDPLDEDTSDGGHGTHVAGIMGAVGDNGVGVAGMNWQTTILPVKWLQSADEETGGLLQALQWLVKAKQEGVNIRVVNDSPTFFGTLPSPAIKEEIEALGAENILFVAAAGNSGENNDEESVRRYPCGYDLANEICVTASDNDDELPQWANYGPHTVDLAAPGVSIYSTLRGGKYGYLTGGSMAAGQVAGAAALILSDDPSLSATDLKARILDNVRTAPALTGRVITGGILDVCRALPDCHRSHQPAPTVTTAAASDLAQSSATLNATVNPEGTTVSECRFDYGASMSYGSSVPCASQPGSGTSPVEVSAAVAGLNPDSTYHFRIVATNAGGTVAGADQTFATPPDPPSVTVGGASDLAQTSATLNAAVNPEGATVSDCHFDYGASVSYGSTVPCISPPGSGTSPVEVSAALSGLSPDTTYHFQILATNPGGTSSSADQTFATPPNPPSVITGAASDLAPSSATLHATVNPEGATVSDCHFEYGASVSYGSNAPCTSLPESGSAQVEVLAAVANLSPDSTYHFRILATNPGGASSGADQTLTTPPLAEKPSEPILTGTQAPLGSGGTLPFTSASPPPVPDAELASTALAVSSSGAVEVKLTCPAAELSCAGTVTLRTLGPVIALAAGSSSPHGRKPAVLRLAAGSFALAGGRVKTVTLHLSAWARRLLTRSPVLRARATIVARDSAGRTHTAQTLVLLRAAKVRRRRSAQA